VLIIPQVKKTLFKGYSFYWMKIVTYTINVFSIVFRVFIQRKGKVQVVNGMIVHSRIVVTQIQFHISKTRFPLSSKDWMTTTKHTTVSFLFSWPSDKHFAVLIFQGQGHSDLMILDGLNKSIGHNLEKQKQKQILYYLKYFIL
jgi:hypothetical protein